jgi:hypothetical protein
MDGWMDEYDGCNKKPVGVKDHLQKAPTVYRYLISLTSIATSWFSVSQRKIFQSSSSSVFVTGGRQSLYRSRAGYETRGYPLTWFVERARSLQYYRPVFTTCRLCVDIARKRGAQTL